MKSEESEGNVGILVAEDSRTQAEQIVFLLQRKGYRVTVAGNGREALRAAQADKPTLIISDVMMPEMDGYSLCKAIKTDAGLKDIPVILVTSLSDSQDVVRGLECGADNFISKPYDERYLLSRIDYLLMHSELRKSQKMQLGVEIRLGNCNHFITAERQQILDLLISTYEQAIHIKNELRLCDKELEHSNEVLHGLFRITEGLNQVSTGREVAEVALERAMELPGIQAGWIMLHEEESGFRTVAARNLPPMLAAPGALDGDCACRRRLLSGDLSDAANVFECEHLGSQGLRCHASIPFTIEGGRVSGLLNLMGAGEGVFSEDELKVLHSVGHQLAVALERARLHEQLELANVNLARREEEIGSIVDHMADCVVTIDERGIIRSANPMVEKVFGYPAADLIGNNVSLLVPLLHCETCEGRVGWHCGTCEADIGDSGSEVEGRHRDGRPIPLELAVSEYSVQGRRYFTGILRDIREQVRIMEDLRYARGEAELANKAKSSFLAAMSHEIRTPMNGVIGMVDMLHQTSLKGYQVEMVDLIRESAFALLTIIDDILDFSKIEAGRLEIESAPMSVAEVVEKVCTMLNHMARKKDVDLTLFIDPEIPEMVMGDALRLRQVLANLASNAIKFSSGRGQRGRVSVRVMLAELRPGRAVVEVRVADNGIGMSQATLSGLFTPFSQADVSTTRRYGGSGLGLAICHNLIKLMGGTITVNSEPDKGSIFTVYFPFEPLAVKAGARTALVAGVKCLVIGGREGPAADVCAYLAHEGAMLERKEDMDAACAVAAGLPPGPWIWVVDAFAAVPQPETLRAIAAGFPTQDIRFVVIVREDQLRLHMDRIVSVERGALTRTALLKAVGIAAGHAREEREERAEGKCEADFEPPPRSEALRQRRLILVVEDNETNQKVILRQLALLGYAADIANNGQAALERWRSGDYALLLSDLHMPKMDGYELTAAIRTEELQNGQRIPIIALTANALKGEAEHCRAAGMDDYLSKPAQLADLKAALEKWLNRPPEASAAETPRSTGPVDVSVLRALVGDDPEVVREFLGYFRASLLESAAELNASTDNRQRAALAHKLKSSARSVGALALGDLCEAMERAGMAGDDAALAALLREFSQAQAEVERFLDEY